MLKSEHEAGFSLVELLVTALIAVVVLGMAGEALINLTTASSRAGSVSASVGSVSQAVALISRDLRSTDVLDATSPSGFTAEVYQDGGTTEKVVWSLSAGNLTRQAGANPAQTIATGLVGPSGFAYYTPSGTPATPTCTSRVGITLVQAPGQQAVTPYREEVSIAVINQAENIAAGNVSC